MRGTIIVISALVSLSILVFNGTLGYFVLAAHYGVPKGVYVFIGLSILAIATSLVPIFMKFKAFRFYFRVLLYTNIIVAFYPLLYKLIAATIIARLL